MRIAFRNAAHIETFEALKTSTSAAMQVNHALTPISRRQKDRRLILRPPRRRPLLRMLNPKIATFGRPIFWMSNFGMPVAGVTVFARPVFARPNFMRPIG